jgi:hypothetical protein
MPQFDKWRWPPLATASIAAAVLLIAFNLPSARARAVFLVAVVALVVLAGVLRFVLRLQN